MALKQKWKTAGKDIGGAFKNLGLSLGETAKVAAGQEDNTVVTENGETRLRESWKKTGKGFKEAGSSFGKAMEATFEDSEDNNKKKNGQFLTFFLY